MRTSIIAVSILISIFYATSPSFCFDKKPVITPIENIETDDQFIHLIIEKVLSSDRYALGKALYYMEKSLKEDTYISHEKEFLCILYHVCRQPVYTDDKETCLHNRKKTLELIGRLGNKTRGTGYGRISKDILIEVLESGNDVSIASAAIFALGMVGMDDEGEVMRSILSAVDKWDSSEENNILALAVITSIENIARENGKISEPESTAVLSGMIRGNYDEMIKEKAAAVMKQIAPVQVRE
ncbi:MAG: HEAT repeat domain-containing protein [Spirochaetales bacterium]|nr:HEAT repeat domain-containing protein [Spirochaetales bacterium]